MNDPKNLDFLDRITNNIDTSLMSRTAGGLSGPEVDYLRTPAPNIVEWVTGVDFWNMPSTFDHSRQYQIMRDVFCTRCPICNSMKPEDIDCWGKSRIYLESETLLVWNERAQDFVCPRCTHTQRELIRDRMFIPYNEMIVLAGMRSGKSYLGAHIGGYYEHFLSTRAMFGHGYLQRMLKQAAAEWFEVTFAASTATQAAQTIYAKYREMRKGSPWVQRYVSWVRGFEERQPAGSDMWTYRTNDDAVLDGWAKVRYNRIASDSRGVAGRTRIAASIDEWARLSDTEGTRSATELYRVLNQSLKTIRAAVDLNDLPAFMGLMINVTSPISQDDPAMETYNKASDGSLKRTYAWKGPTWEFNPQMPREVFDEEYVKDPVAAERDFGANPPNAESPFVDDPKRFWKSVDFERKPIATFQSTYLTDPTGKDYVGSELAHCALDHTNTYYIFGDAGLTWDSFALVCAHPEWIDASEFSNAEVLDENGVPVKKPQQSPPGAGRVEPSTGWDVVFAEQMGSFMGANIPVGADGAMIKESQANRRRAMTAMDVQNTGRIPYDHMGEMLCTVVDFALRIVPTVDRDIWFNSVVDVVESLQKKIRIGGVAFDHWNSESTIQQLRTMGILARKVTLKTEHFMGFLRMSYNGRVKLLPPDQRDTVGLTDTGALVIGTPQEEMQPSSVALVELLKLTRSPDLRKFYNPKKGQIRGKDSDDLARCYVGAHHLVQDSIVDEMANQKRRMSIRKRQIATDSGSVGQVYQGRGQW